MTQFPEETGAPRIIFSGTKDQAREVILEHISELSHIPVEGITPQCSLSHDLSFDSLDKVELVMWCEMTFDIAINHDEPTDTVDHIIDAVLSKI